MLTELLVVFLISAVASKLEPSSCTFHYWNLDWHSAVETCAQDNKRLLCYESRKDVDDVTEAFRLAGYNDAELDIWMYSKDCTSQSATECLSLHIKKWDGKVWHFFQELCTENYPFVCCTKDSGPPTFEEAYEEIRMEEGCEAKVWCRASGEEPLQYVWHDEFSNEISSERNYSLYSLVSSNGSALIFDPITLHDKGLYTCSAKNIHGLRSKVYNISVYPNENEAAKILFVNILNITDESVTFSFNVSGKPLRYIVRYIESWENKMWTQKVKADNKIEIRELIPSGRYKFQFKAQSDVFLEEDWTIKYEIILLPEAPDVIFRSLGSGALKIEWSRLNEDTRRATIDEYKLSYGLIKQGQVDCPINITIPACAVSSYTIAGLSKDQRYDFSFAAHTKSGYGKSTNFKIYTE